MQRINATEEASKVHYALLSARESLGRVRRSGAASGINASRLTIMYKKLTSLIERSEAMCDDMKIDPKRS